MKMFSLLCLLMIIEIISCDDKGVVRRVRRVSEDVVLPCSLGPENIEQDLFDWTKGRQEVFLYNGGFYDTVNSQFRGRVFHFPDKLINGNASIIIRNLTLSDSGNFSCIFPRLQQQRFHVELVVGVGNIQQLTGKYAEPRVMILEISERWALLQCEVHGASPKSEISWIDSDGVVLPAEEKLEDSDDLRYPSTLMLQTNVTKTDNFSCRVTQKELNFTTEAQISVLIYSDETVTGSNGVLLGVAIGGLTVVLLCLVAVGTYCWWYRRRAMRAEPQETREPEREPEPEPEPEPESEPESDEALRIPLQESLTSSDGNPSKHCQPFFST